MEIFKFGSGKRLDLSAKMLESILKVKEKSAKPWESPSENKAHIERTVILPIPTSRDGETITNTKIKLTNIYEYITPETLVVGYQMPKDFKDFIKKNNALIYDAAEDEDFLQKNAILTAHGALGRILTEESADIKDLKIGIIGYGRIGEMLTKILLFLGGQVCVYSTRDDKIYDLKKCGLDAEKISESVSFRGIDILINTAPSTLISRMQETEILDSGTKIIELASGKNFSDERVIFMPSIPDKMYPISAAKIYFDGIKNAIIKAEK